MKFKHIKMPKPQFKRPPKFNRGDKVKFKHGEVTYRVGWVYTATYYQYGYYDLESTTSDKWYWRVAEERLHRA